MGDRMSYFGSAVSIKDGPNLDAFSRLRISQPTSLFEAQQEYGISPLYWGNATSGAGSSISTDANTKVTSILAGTGATDYALLQSHQYIRYIPGKGHFVLITGVFSPGAVENNVTRTGYFDSANGVFLSVSNGTAAFTVRTSTSGSVDDTSTVTQANWNIDKFDGTGPSGVTIDLTKTQIMFIQAQWLGVGRVVVGFDVDGLIYPAHQFMHANHLIVPYTQSFNLPVRLESRNTGITAGATAVKFICCSVQSEGGTQDLGIPGAAGNGINDISVTTRRAVASIRCKATFKTFVNRGHVEMRGLDVIAEDNPCYWELIYNATLGGTPSWTSTNDESIVEFDVAGTTITGGLVLASGYATAGAKSFGSGGGITSVRNPLTISKIDGGTTTQNTLTLAATSLNSTSKVAAALNWFERYI